jgi:hypothetical protein
MDGNLDIPAFSSARPEPVADTPSDVAALLRKADDDEIVDWLGNTRRTRRRAERMARIITMVIGVLLVAGIARAIIGAPSLEESEKEVRESPGMMACIKAVDAVTSRLKAPSTAKFPDCGWNWREYRIQVEPKEVYVHGYVDAQNGFGAMLRSQFTVVFNRTSTGNGLALRGVVIQ